MNTKYALLASILCLASLAAAQDEACTSIGGTCVDWRNFQCHGGVETGLCSGDSNIRCCLTCDAQCQSDEADYDASGADSVCEADNDGHCMPTSNYCNG